MLKVFETRRDAIRMHLKRLEALVADDPRNYNFLLEKFNYENYLTLYTDGIDIQSNDKEAVETWLNDFGAACKERFLHYSEHPTDHHDLVAAITARDLLSEIDYALWLLACPRQNFEE